jgi:hypothetical protein
MILPRTKALAGIEYVGLPGISAACKEAVLRLIQCGDRISLARILSNAQRHCLLFNINGDSLLAVKSGFGSGYGGEGPRTFSLVLQLLHVYGVSIEEFDVDFRFIERVDRSALTKGDISFLASAPPVRPLRWPDYVFEEHWKLSEDGTFGQHFRPVMPFAIIDNRVADLAMDFFHRPDEALLTGYRRLEDVIRERTGLVQHGADLFSRAFRADVPALIWPGVSENETKGRMLLFVGAFQAFRNPRAHRESRHDVNAQLTEFLLLNHLFVLERAAKARPRE